MKNLPTCPKITRRDFLIATTVSSAYPALAAEIHPILRFGIITDLHYADADPRGTRYYRDSRGKLDACVQEMNERKVDFLIELGDFKDQDTPPIEVNTLRYLDDIEAQFKRFNGPRYHVLGNHDMDSLSKSQFLSHIENTQIPPEKTYYSFERNGIHLLVLDANFNADGTGYDHGNFEWTDANLPQVQLDWLQSELESSNRPAIVFIHQLLDGEGSVFVKNAAEVRKILESSGNVLAVFQGHHHEGRVGPINGILYYTLKGAIEGSGLDNNSYAIVEIYPDNGLSIVGKGNATSVRFP